MCESFDHLKEILVSFFARVPPRDRTERGKGGGGGRRRGKRGQPFFSWFEGSRLYYLPLYNSQVLIPILFSVVLSVLCLARSSSSPMTTTMMTTG